MNINAAPDDVYDADTTYSCYIWWCTGASEEASTTAASALYTTILGDIAAGNEFSTDASYSQPLAYNTDLKKMTLASAVIPDADITSASGTAFLIIFDAEDYGSAEHYLVAQKNGSQYITQTWGGQGGKGFTFGTQATNTNWQSIPEPTSGLLLLIGVAGLALRRRRA